MQFSNRKIFSELIETCDGMLAPNVYAQIHDAARRGGIIVEVGTALGAATVALALGLKSSGLPGHIYSFDPMEGGPRRSISSTAARLERIHANLARYSVDELVTVTTSDLGTGLPVLPTGQRISVLMLDADGRIDRDLETLQDKLEPDCSLIIDDVADKVRVKRRGSTYRVDSKMRLSFLMTAMLKKTGRISSGQTLVDTYFGKLLTTDGPLVDRDETIEVYRQLVFQSASATTLQYLKDKVSDSLLSRTPNLAAKSRKIYRSIKYVGAARK